MRRDVQDTALGFFLLSVTVLFRSEEDGSGQQHQGSQVFSVLLEEVWVYSYLISLLLSLLHP